METLTPQERKEQYIQTLQKQIEDRFNDGRLTTSFEECLTAHSCT